MYLEESLISSLNNRIPYENGVIENACKDTG